MPQPRPKALKLSFHLPMRLPADGPFWGGNPMWGALGATVLSLIIGSILAYALVSVSALCGRGRLRGRR